ncbi:MAG: c-type cytochrome [Burkholderiales bacterium]
MNTISKRSYPAQWLMTGACAVTMTVALTACESPQQRATTPSAAPLGGMSADAMIAQAMANMDKIMMLSPEDQKQYIMASQANSLRHGQQLFESASLGTNGFTCATCHPKGSTTGGKVPVGKMQVAIPDLKGAAATFPKFKVPNDGVITLQEMNNNCVVMFLKGQPIRLGSQDARDLASYVTGLSENEPLTPGRQSEM